MSTIDTSEQELMALIAEMEAEAAKPKVEPGAAPSKPVLTEKFVEKATTSSEPNEPTVVGPAGPWPSETELEHLAEEQARDLAEAAAKPQPEEIAMTASQRIIAEAHAAAKAKVATIKSEESKDPAPTISETPPPAPKSGTAPSGLATFINPDEFADHTKVTPENLEQCFYEQNGLEAYYGNKAALAQRQYELAKQKAEVKEAELYAKHRARLTALGEKVTEKLVEQEVKLDPAWIKIQALVIDARQIAETVKSCSWSVNNRRDMILALGAQKRQEMQGQARLVERDMRQFAMQTIGGKGA